MVTQNLTSADTPTFASITSSGNTYVNGRMRSGARDIILATTNDFDVSDIMWVWVNTSSGAININGLSGGIENQIIILNKVSGANPGIIIHNSGTGTQKILTPDGLDLNLQTYGGIPLIYDGSNWYVIRPA